MTIPITRRDALTMLAAGTATLLGCSGGEEFRHYGSSTLSARPGGTTFGPAGSFPLNLASGRDGFLYAPPHVGAHTSLPLVLALHGAGGSAAQHMTELQSDAQRLGFLLLGVDSRGQTWDAVRDEFGPDITFIDRALKWVFARYLVDPARVVVSGFSDGASYALGLGVTNSELFRKTIAFSPGFVPPSDSPMIPGTQIWVSHGTNDQILEINRSSRAIVPQLRAHGYNVTYTEFDGGHIVPDEIASAAADWVMT